MERMFLKLLEPERVERHLSDKKPLMTAAEASAESERCLYCSDAPCIKACPTEIDIPTFIKKIATGNVRGSARTIFEQNLLGYSCARVCPVEVLCEGSCVYQGWTKNPIKIGRLQRFATEHATGGLDPERAEQIFTPKASAASAAPAVAPIKKRVACIGAGPASLAFAGYLALEGHHAVVFEKRALPGGLNTTGVAPYKLHADDALREVEWVRALGVDVRTGVELGERGTSVTGEKLLHEYDAVFIGVGLGEDNKLGVPGEDGPGVVGATAWIEAMKLAGNPDAPKPKLGKVMVIGGGNTAIDVARECALLGADEVMMAYRRGVDEMSGYAHELDGGRKEGVRFLPHVQPVGFVRDADGILRGVTFVKTEGGRAIAGTEHDVACDFVALAIGQSKLRAVASELPGVALDARGCIVADAKTGATGNPKVFSGGDCINGGKEVVNAVADGRNAARFLMARWAR